MLRHANISRLWGYVLLGVIALGVGLKFYALQYMEFKGDEFNAFALAAAHLQHLVLPKVGLVSSTGLYNPPFFLELLWPPLLLSRDPVVVTGWIVLLNAAGIAGLAWMLKRMGGETIAWHTAAVIAVSPWLFILSRKIWAQDALFPFLILLHGLLLAYVGDRKPWRIWVAGVVMALITQLHMSAWVMPLAIAAWLLLLRAWPRWRDIGIGAAAFVILYLPYIAFHIDDNFQNLSGTTTQHPGSLIDQLRWFVGINGSGGLWYMWGPVPPPSIPFWLLTAANVGTVCLGLAAVVGFAIAARRMWCTSRRFRAPEHITPVDQYILLLMLITAVSLVVFIVMGIPALPHYHLVFLPLVALLTSVAVTSTWSPWRWLAEGLFGIMLAVFIGLIVSMHSVIIDHPEELKGDYGVPYHTGKDHWGPYIEAVQQGKMRLNRTAE